MLNWNGSANDLNSTPTPEVPVELREAPPNTREVPTPSCSGPTAANTASLGGYTAPNIIPIPPTPNWKPWTVHWIFISTLIFLHLLQICAIIYILWRFNHLEAGDTGSVFLFKSTKLAPYVAWQFLPVFVAVVMGILWGIVDASVRQMEPYYQLSRRMGIPAGGTLCSDYSMTWAFGIPLKSGRRGQWAVTLSSLVHVISFSFIPSLASGMLRITWPLPKQGEEAHAVVWIEKRVVHAALGASALLVVLATVLMVVLMRRTSGMISEPGGLAGLASLICDSENVLKIFRELPPCVSERKINATLEGKMFWLQYGTVYRENRAPELAYQIAVGVDERRYRIPIPPPFRLYRILAHPLVLWGRSLIITEFLIAGSFIAIQVSVYSEGKWLPLVIKAIYTFSTTLITSYFQMVVHALCLIQPYMTLVERPSVPKSKMAVLTDYNYLSPLRTIVTALRNGSFVVASSVVTMLLMHLATIIFPTLFQTIWDLWLLRNFGNYSPLPPTLEKCINYARWPSYVILVYGFFQMFAMMMTRRKPIMPRIPDSMASNIAYLTNSIELLEAVKGTSLMTSEERKEKILGLWENGIGFGWLQSGRSVGVEVNDRIMERYQFPQVRPGGVRV